MAQTPNVLWIVMDSQRPHNIGAYGDQRGVTPTLDRLADEGVVFERNTSASPWCLPSHASMMTGLYASTHGADGCDSGSNDREVGFIPETSDKTCRNTQCEWRHTNPLDRTGAVVSLVGGRRMVFSHTLSAGIRPRVFRSSVGRGVSADIWVR